MRATGKPQYRRSGAKGWTDPKVYAILRQNMGPKDMGMFVRWLFAFVLLTATYNPTEWNYLRWSMANYETRLSIAVLAGLILAIGYIIYLRATLRSIGGFGMFLVLAVVAAMLWVLYDLGMLSLENTDVNAWLGIFSLSAVLGIGLSWSQVRRQLSGQSDVDDLND
ncbi:MAG: hypothetical protein ACI9BH_002108 [Paracoccaceae bacterium]